MQKTLERIDVRRKERAASTSHGQDFQSQVYDRILTEAQRLGDFATLVANTPGRIPPRCKTGDVLIELGAETSAPGAKVVAEAKEEKDYKLADARIEIDKARENRDAEGGLFVFSKATAPEGLEPLSRYGQDVFVVWDASDPTSDAYLTLGLSVARALCVHKVNKRDSENADFRAIDDAIAEIKKQIEKLEEVRSWTGTIQTNSGKVLKSVENAINTLVKQVENLSTRMEDLKRATTEV